MKDEKMYLEISLNYVISVGVFLLVHSVSVLNPPQFLLTLSTLPHISPTFTLL